MKACISCSKLEACSIVDEQKLLNNYFCDFWAEIKPVEKIAARITIIQQYGLSGVKAVLCPEIKGE